MKENDVFLGYFNDVEVFPFGSLVKVVLSDMQESDTGEYIAYISDKVLYIAQNDNGSPLLPEKVISIFY